MAGGAHIGLIGFGAIGRDLHAHLPGFRVTVLTRHGGTPLPQGVAEVHALDALIAADPSLVVEAAGQAAAADLLPPVLEAGIDAVIGSTGVLGDEAVLARMLAAAETGAARLIVPAGAVGGLDYLAALGPVEGTRVTYTSRKPVAAWTDELRALGQDPATLAGEHLLFEGTAREAAKLYPRNLNAGLTIALAAGHARTTVRVIADPAATGNTHEIAVESPLGHAQMRFANLPSPANPKTSALTALSLALAVRQHSASIVI